MVTLAHRTPPRLDAPAYAVEGDGVMIHRYLDDAFVPRFLDELTAWRLPGAAAQDWRRTDRFGARANGLPTLRLPVHRAFYVVCCEASCDEAGRPALDPRRVASAGFVIRRGSPERPQVWQIGPAGPVGWRVPEAGAEADPDERRRLARAGLLRAAEARRAATRPLATGEETYPLRPILVDAPADGALRPRKRTMLHGFLPLSGSAPLVASGSAEGQGGPSSVSGRLAEFAWPFGCWSGDPDAGPPVCGVEDSAAAMADCCGAFSWRQRDGAQIIDAVPEDAFAGLLRAMIERWRVQDATNPDNARLRAILSAIRLRTNLTRPPAGAEGDADLSATTAHVTLLAWVEARAEALTDWFAERDAAARGVLSGSAPSKLPGLDREDLYIAEEEALDLREAIVARGEADERALEQTLAIPRFGQGVEDVFHVRAFLRWIDDRCCERLVWGPVSAPFRVVSPLDPEAAAPVAIQLPELDDVKRGLAKGVTFLTPKSLMDQMDRIKPDMEFAEQGGGNRLAACLSFSLSFSIPAITICAMLLLMIILQLLNLFFRWLPYVFLRFALKCR